MNNKSTIVVVITAMAITYGLSRLLAAAVTSGEKREERELSPHLPVPAQRATEPVLHVGR
jgi:hypothetical protein